ESSPDDMGTVVQHCALLQSTFLAAVLIVHHTGKSGQSERGSTALRGAADSMIEIKCDKSGRITVACDKLKDGEPWPDEEFAFANVPGTDSGVLLPAVLPRTVRPSQRQQAILEVLDAAPNGVASAEAIGKQIKKSEQTVYRELKTLKDKDLVEQ